MPLEGDKLGDRCKLMTKPPWPQPRRGARAVEGDITTGGLTSGKVPLEKTLRWVISLGTWTGTSKSTRAGQAREKGRYIHQQAGLSAGSIADDDEFASDLRHVRSRDRVDRSLC